MTQSVCQDTPSQPHSPRAQTEPALPEQQPHSYPINPSVSAPLATHLASPPSPRVISHKTSGEPIFRVPRNLSATERGDLNRQPGVGQRGRNNHHTLPGDNHLIERPLGPLIPRAKLSHTPVTSAPSPLLDLQRSVCEGCVCERAQQVFSSAVFSMVTPLYMYTHFPTLSHRLFVLCFHSLYLQAYLL